MSDAQRLIALAAWLHRDGSKAEAQAIEHALAEIERLKDELERVMVERDQAEVARLKREAANGAVGKIPRLPLTAP